MDNYADNEHLKAHCPLQSSFFKELILRNDPNHKIVIYDTYNPKFNSLDFKNFDAFMWTGGLGNIYEINDFNKIQLNIAEKILMLDKPIWASCWGLQVFVTVYGGKISNSSNPEFGYSSNIKILKNSYVYKNKLDKFSAPGHHYDSIETLPNELQVIAENSFSIQAIEDKNKKLFCTQYHPELPYTFIAKLMLYWKKNYLKTMTENSFKILISKLENLEKKDNFNRKLELINWIENL